MKWIPQSCTTRNWHSWLQYHTPTKNMQSHAKQTSMTNPLVMKFSPILSQNRFWWHFNLEWQSLLLLYPLRILSYTLTARYDQHCLEDTISISNSKIANKPANTVIHATSRNEYEKCTTNKPTSLAIQIKLLSSPTHFYQHPSKLLPVVAHSTLDASRTKVYTLSFAFHLQPLAISVCKMCYNPSQSLSRYHIPPQDMLTVLWSIRQGNKKKEHDKYWHHPLERHGLKLCKKPNLQ